jgi:hypothetical protein
MLFDWLRIHAKPHITPAPDNKGKLEQSPFGSAVPLKLPPPTTTPYVNGMKDPVVGGFVTLEAAEAARTKAINSGNNQLIIWAKTVLPYRYAIRDAASQPEFAMSAEDQFSCFENQQYAHTFYFFLDPGGKLEKSTWCPVGFVATYPLPTQHKLYNQGPVLPGYASFAPTVGIADIPKIFEDALAAAGQ